MMAGEKHPWRVDALHAIRTQLNATCWARRIELPIHHILQQLSAAPTNKNLSHQRTHLEIVSSHRLFALRLSSVAQERDCRCDRVRDAVLCTALQVLDLGCADVTRKPRQG